MSVRLPYVVSHADWGKSPPKRWMARAVRDTHGSYRARPAERVVNAGRLLPALRDAAPLGESALVGFDFPIGLPYAYAKSARISGYLSFLEAVGGGSWSEFFDVAESSEQITLQRPFYPQRPGGCEQAHLLDALQVSTMDELRRQCERKQPTRRAACSLFWTLGGQQVGKAAIAGWREVLIPALKEMRGDIAIWPFDGALEELLKTDRVVVAETYPAEFYDHLNVVFRSGSEGGRSGKRVQTDRAANARALLTWAERVGVEMDRELETEIGDGFGGGSDGEDRFDAVIGLLGMLNVLLGHRPSGESGDEKIQSIEGWILGQRAL